MELLITQVSVLQMLGYDDFFQLRNTKFLINGNVLLPFLLIKNLSDSLTSKHQIIDILMSYSEVLFDLL